MNENITEHNENTNPVDKNYQLPESAQIDGLLELSDKLNASIDENKPREGDLWEKIQDKLKIAWTYNSNAIEGSTLTQGETMFFLQNGLTVEGKPFKDFIDAKNHAEAIDFLFDIIKDNRPISEGVLKEFNSFLLSGIKDTDALDQQGNRVKKPATPGQYKKLPNHVLQTDGTIHKYVEPLQVQPEMEMLCNWINENLETLHPLEVSAIAHYNMVRIHPFDDGNGRGARILMNLILIKKGFPPAIIENEKRRKYIETLAAADTGELAPFVEFVAESCVDTQKMIAEDLEGGKAKS